ncbi:hypothetical protein AB0F91_45660 [Amycolatopsis sp. NPDC023774]|uniref:hypothetical protein n=1 Tax=Amycolatopsis sp. NPDC023774 TaxID=3155015 RepID=UPI00341125DC
MTSDDERTAEHPTLDALDLANDIAWWLQGRDGMSADHDGQGNVRVIDADGRVFDIHVQEESKLMSSATL